MLSRSFIIVVGAVAWLASPLSQAVADTDTREAINLIDQKAENKSAFDFDYGVPTSPALRLLDRPSDKIQVSTGLKPFILSIPSVLLDGDDGQSIALDVAPAWIIGSSRDRTFTRYTDPNNLVYRVLLKTHVNIAAYEGVDSSNADEAERSRIALGVSTSILDQSDPLMASFPGSSGKSAWAECISRRVAVFRALVETRPPNDEQRLDLEIERSDLGQQVRDLRKDLQHAEQAGRSKLKSVIETEIIRIEKRLEKIDDLAASNRTVFNSSAANAALKGCADQANIAARFGASLDVSAGALLHGDEGRIRDFDRTGYAAWAAFRYPVNFLFDSQYKPTSGVMVGFSGRVSFDEFLDSGDKAVGQVQADTWDVWGGLEWLNANTRLAAQVGYQGRNADDAPAGFDKERWRYLVNVSQRVSGRESGVWLKVSYGHVSQAGDDDEMLLVALTFAPPDPANLFGQGK